MWGFMSNLFGGGTQEEGAERAKAIGEGDTEAAGAQEDPELRQGRGKFGNLAMKAVMSYVGGGYGGEGAAAGEAAAGAGEAAGGMSGAAELGAAADIGGAGAAATPAAGASGLYDLGGAGGTPAGVSPDIVDTRAPATMQKEFDWADYVANAAKNYGKQKLQKKTGKYANFEQVFGGGGNSSGLYANW